MSEARNSFESRFQSVVSKMRFNRVLTILAWTLAAIVAGILVVATLDYFLETGWSLRAVLFFLTLGGAVGAATWSAAAALKRWNRRSTAAKVEQRFEDLGQSVRTSVQFNGQTESAGVSPRLLSALHEDVQQRTEDLRLGEAVSTGQLKFGVLVAGGLALLAGAAVWSSWDWRMAIGRTLLGNTPYTAIKVHEGDTLVDEKASLTLTTDVTGRTNREVKLLTRELAVAKPQKENAVASEEASEGDEATESKPLEWTTRLLGNQDETKRETRFVSYQLEFPKVKTPFEYQIVAGKYASPVHRVDVRYPLAIEEFHITVTSPEYTGLAPRKFDKGSFDAVQGSFARLEFVLDHQPAKAWLELRPTMTALGEEPEVETVPLEVSGTLLTAELELEEDRIYQVFAETNDGTTLRPNRFRIRVNEDRPPRLSFRKPSQLIEVHPLAEILMRLKVSDDYGLRRVGIRLQKNNEQEITLEDIAIEDVVTEDGKLSPQTQQQIESLVPLEYFELELKDSISYYGFAEDNYPDGSQLNETDLQFVDMRPFRQNFRMPDPDSLNGMGNNNDDDPNRRQLPELNEMIGRERFVVNRTRQIERRESRGKAIDSGSIDNLVGIQNETSEFAGLMGDQATIVEAQLGITDENQRISDLLYAAQDDMLASIDSLSGNEWQVAQLQEKDALQHLLDARNRLEQSANNGRGGGGAFRAAFRRLRNRLRRPRNDQERAREIVRRLKQAAAEQDFLMEKISDLAAPEMPEMEEPSEDEMQEEEDQDEETRPEDETLDSEEMQDEDQDSDADVDDAMDEEQELEDEMTLDELRREVETEQLELSDEFRDITDLIQRLNQISSLAEQRTQRTGNMVNSVVDAVERFDTEAAINTAALTSRMLRTLAANIEGITADESTSRLAIARDLGMLLTDDLQHLEDGLKDAEEAANESELEAEAASRAESEMAQDLSAQALQQYEVAKTIEDILDSILDPETGIQDQEDLMVKRLQEITGETKLAESIERMQRLPETIDGLDWIEAGVQTDDLGDRFDIVSQRLDAMHREILAPRIEQLRKLEKRAVETREQLSEFETKDQVERWHIRANGLLQDVTSAEVAAPQVGEVRAAMESGGWGSEGAEGWNSDGEGLSAPVSYETSLTGLIDEIQRYILELSMIDVDVVNTGAIPPKYRHFVERYFELMSGATK